MAVPEIQTITRSIAADNQEFVTFTRFDGMDSQALRESLDAKKQSWLENLQPVSDNQLLSVPAAAAALTTVAGTVFIKFFYGNYAGSDFLLGFGQDGTGWQISLANGAQLRFAPPGTFSNPDAVQWQSSTMLIADPTAGYSAWNGTTLARSGSLSTSVIVTNGGTTPYTTPPTVTVTGGTGVGASFTAVLTGGFVTSVVVNNTGSGYSASDVLTLHFTGGGGAGAAGTITVFPQIGFNPTTVAVFAGRAWLAGGRILYFTGTGGFDDGNTANAAGQATIQDTDLVHSITALRSLNNYLYIFGDNSVKQLGSVAVVSSATTYTITTISSDQGTTFPQSIISYNRLVLFANFVGIWAIFGATIEKISNEMDGVFRNINFVRPIQAAVCDLNSLHTALFLVSYNDPNAGIFSPAFTFPSQRSIMMAFVLKKWFIASQGNNIRVIATCPLGGTLHVYSSSGGDATEIFKNPSGFVTMIYRSALTEDNKPFLNKTGVRGAISQFSTQSTTITLTTDTENAIAQ